MFDFCWEYLFFFIIILSHLYHWLKKHLSHHVFCIKVALLMYCNGCESVCGIRTQFSSVEKVSLSRRITSCNVYSPCLLNWCLILFTQKSEWRNIDCRTLPFFLLCIEELFSRSEDFSWYSSFWILSDLQCMISEHFKVVIHHVFLGLTL